MKLLQDFLQKPEIKVETSLQLDSPPLEESYQQYHQLQDLPNCLLIIVKGVVGEHILDTYTQQKMLCALNARKGHYSLQCQSTTVAMVSIEPRQILTDHTHQHYADIAYLRAQSRTFGKLK